MSLTSTLTQVWIPQRPQEPSLYLTTVERFVKMIFFYYWTFIFVCLKTFTFFRKMQNVCSGHAIVNMQSKLYISCWEMLFMKNKTSSKTIWVSYHDFLILEYYLFVYFMIFMTNTKQLKVGSVIVRYICAKSEWL